MEGTGLKHHIRKIFRRNPGVEKENSGPAVQPEAIITPTDIKELSAGAPANSRERKIIDITQRVKRTRLQQFAPEAITKAVEDLLTHPDKSKRHLVLNLIHAIIIGQDNDCQLGMLREYYFHLISKQNSEDQQPCLEILRSLTKDGMNLTYIDEQIGDLIVQWLNDFSLSNKNTGFLELLINIIKFNGAFLEEKVATEIVNVSCSLCNKTTHEDEIKLCLQVLESILKYFYLESTVMLPFCATLCRTVLLEACYQRSWKLMRELLGTHLGHSALFTLTQILSNSDNLTDHILLKGAIFFVSTALWGHHRVDTLQISSTAVLPCFISALHSNSNSVAADVSTTILRLVRKFGKLQPAVLWEHVMNILDILDALIQKTPIGEAHMVKKISVNLHDILTAMEELQESGNYSSNPDRLFAFIERTAASRPESSVMMLLEHRAQTCRPPTDTWLENLEGLLTKYYRTETRTAIRSKALYVLDQILSTNRIMYEEPLLELVLRVFSTIHLDPDVSVRSLVVKLLVKLAKTCVTKKCTELMNLIEKVINREKEPNLRTPARSEPDYNSQCEDILAAIVGITEIFKTKLMEPRGSQVTQTLDILVSHISKHYTQYRRSHTASLIRHSVFTLFLSLRVDKTGRVGIEGETFSSYVFCSEKYLPDGDDGMERSDMSTLDFSAILRSINQCLLKEADWKVLHLVLEGMSKQWQNKTLIHSTEDNMVDDTCTALCTVLKASRESRRQLYNTPPNFKQPDFHNDIFPALTCMTAYHSYLHGAKIDLVTCLGFGLVTSAAPICVHTLRVCCLEMESIMMRMLDSILQKLSQIAANKNMAIPLLMFLSCLVRLPRLYSNFNINQYRFIFAIALPYTNPFRFKHFPVYLAYHVIIMWFVKCRLMYRPKFAQFIIKGLRSNIKEIETQSAGDQPSSAKDAVYDRDSLLTFHKELQETCVDVMARYAFSTHASVPKRTPLSEFLLEGGRSQSWFLGHKLVTITTSGGVSKVTKTGLCEKCNMTVRGDSSGSSAGGETGRKRHRSAAVRRPSNPTVSSEPCSQDDIEIHRRIDSINEGETNTDDLITSVGSDSESETLTNQAGSFDPGQCNCWCNGWAEINVRRPSGDTSWILRIQNQQLFNYEDFPLADISSFMASPLKSPHPGSEYGIAQKKIESGSLEETEYEHEHEKHFHTPRSLACRNLSLDIGADTAGQNGSSPEISRISRADSHPSHPRVSQTQSLRLPTAQIGSKSSAFARQTSLTDLEAEDAPVVSFLLPEEQQPLPEITPMMKPRSHTFSYSSNSTDGRPVLRHKTNAARDTRSGINPSFVFLQLYHSAFMQSSSLPILIPEGEEYARMLKLLKLLHPYEKHKVGVVYVGPKQCKDAAAILSNTYGSRRYSEFIKRLGTLLSLQDSDPGDMFTGGLDHTENSDGKYTYVWHDEVVQMVFHIATLMPTLEQDKKCDNKKRHIGNNFVTVVYNDSEEDFTFGTIKGQFNYVNLVIKPLDSVSSSVQMLCKDEIRGILEHVSTKVISDESVPSLVKQIALHSSMAANVYQNLQSQTLYASNWLERLRHLKRMKSKLAPSATQHCDTEVDDFTEYVGGI